jgi:hypothetical protein
MTRAQYHMRLIIWLNRFFFYTHTEEVSNEDLRMVLELPCTKNEACYDSRITGARSKGRSRH